MSAVARVLVAALGPVLVVLAVLALQSVLVGSLPVVRAPVAAIVALAVYWLHARYLERREPVELAPRGLPWLASGILAGVALIATVVAVLAVLGVYHVQGPAPFPVDVAGAAALALETAVIEETLFRGYLFRWTAAAGPWAALLVTSLVFGFAHAWNPHATLLSSAAIAVEAGLLLGAAYWLSGNLWFPIGLHLGWNFTEGTIFSTPVSGVEAPGLLVGTLSGPAALTGGAFGIEASLVALALCMCAGIAMIVLCVKRGAHVVR